MDDSFNNIFRRHLFTMGELHGVTGLGIMEGGEGICAGTTKPGYVLGVLCRHSPKLGVDVCIECRTWNAGVGR